MFEYPSIYLEADKISNNIQRKYLLCLKIYFLLLLSSGVIFFYFNEIFLLKVINAVFSLIIVAFSFLFYFYDFQGKWYAARAVAESIKTLSWRYVSKVEPFIMDENLAKLELVKRMKHILDMNHQFKAIISSTCCTNESVPKSMSEIRKFDFYKRGAFYHEYRVIEQQNWYKKKSENNKKNANIFFGILIIISFFIALFLFLNISSRNLNFPVSILISSISIVFTWIQTKKYKELATSYALAAHEIGFISAKSFNLCTEESLNDYVTNAENAFSREHTQWLARKDT